MHSNSADYCMFPILSIFLCGISPHFPTCLHLSLINKGRTLSIIGPINGDDWTSEQEHIGLTPPTSSAPDVTCSQPACAHIPFVTAVFREQGDKIEWAAMEI